MKKGTLHPVFAAPLVFYTPAEIRKIRHMLGETVDEFKDRFVVSDSTVKSWETPEGRPKHRPLDGPAIRLMYCAAMEANSRGSSINNLIRVACRAVKLG